MEVRSFGNQSLYIPDKALASLTQSLKYQINSETSDKNAIKQHYLIELGSFYENL